MVSNADILSGSPSSYSEPTTIMPGRSKLDGQHGSLMLLKTGKTRVLLAGVSEDEDNIAVFKAVLLLLLLLLLLLGLSA
jgi:hypothetical protein